MNLVFSAEDLVACEQYDFGCDGGTHEIGFEYLETPGVLTEKCFPYTSENGVVPTCPSTCVQGKWKRYRCIPGSTV